MVLLIFALVFTMSVGQMLAEDNKFIYTGEGDDVLTIEAPGEKDFFLMKVNGNESERYFGITGYDGEGNRISNYVNATYHYDGLRPIYDPVEMLEVEAEGAWEIELKPISYVTVVDIPGVIEGNGDYVFKIDESVNVASVSGNEMDRYFGVTVFDEDFNRVRNIVNTTQEYEGNVMVAGEAVYFVVEAQGDWKIEF